MRSSVLVLVTAFGLLAACKASGGEDRSSGAAQAGGSQDPHGHVNADGETSPGTTGADETPPKPSSALPPIEVLAEQGTCAPLPELPSDATEERRDAAEIAKALRALACQPKLHAATVSETREIVDLPDWITLELFEGGARLEPERKPSAKALAEALGLETPVARLEWQAYHDQWYLGSDPTTGTLRGYGPGLVTVMLSLDADEGDPPGKVVPLPDDTELRGVFMVDMPETAVKMGADPEGMKQLSAALLLLSKQPDMLALKPEVVAASLGMESERWRFARVTRMAGGTSTHGISIDPERTRVPADELAGALGFDGAKAVNVNAEHDVWNLQAGGTTEIPLGQLELSVSVSPADRSGNEASLDGTSATFISLLPRDP